MASDSSRLAQVFIWREGTAPDLDYARQVISAANPAISEALSVSDPPIRLLSIPGQWPEEPWAHAVADMHSIPASGGTRWDDTAHYDLAGWEGTDLRTGAHLFAVTAYSRAVETEAFKGRSVSAPHTPPMPVPQVPYYPQHPTGPLPWPPETSHTSPEEVLSTVYGVPSTGSAIGASHAALLDVAVRDVLSRSYAPFYASFGRRLLAGLLDLIFAFLLQAAAVAGILWKGSTTQAPFLSGEVGTLAVSLCLSMGTIAAYHVVQWSIWGQTLGKRVVGIKVVRANGERPDVAHALLRMVGYFFSASLAGVGFLMIALDPRRQALHDRLAETFVVPETPDSHVPPGLPGYKSSAQSLSQGHVPLHYVPTSAGIATLGMAAVGGSASPSIIKIASSGDMSEGATNFLQPLVAGENDPSGDTILADEIDYGHGPEEGQSPLEDPSMSAAALKNDPAGMSTPNWGIVLQGPVTDMNLHESSLHPDAAANAEKARAFFKAGLSALEEGAEPGPVGYKVSPQAARNAVAAFREALYLVPSSVAYHYFYSVALRYSEGYEVASREFGEVLEVDPSHFEARQQVAYGARWHDAFAYPAWVSPTPVPIGAPLPESIVSLLPAGSEAVTRLALLREGGNKVAALLSRTARADWTKSPNADMPAHLQLKLTRTQYGPILALYVMIEDDSQNPFIGETFLNPHDPPHLSEDACLMGQHLLEQLARQDRTYLIFADEDNRLLLSRKLAFDSDIQVSLARTLYEVQSLPPQEMDQLRFRQAANWHMQNFPLDQEHLQSSFRNDIR